MTDAGARSHAVHPQAAARIASIAASGEPPMETLQPAEARRVANLRVRNNGWPSPSLHAVENRTLHGPGGDIPIRIYRPHAQRAPLILFFHGGGFMVGNLDTHDALCRSFAQRTQAIVLAVDYRLAPEHKFPAAPDDCLFATRWVFEHAREIGFDAARVALLGESSGGSLVAVVAQALAAAGGPSLRLQVMIYAALDLAMDTQSYRDFENGYFFTRAKARYFFNHYLSSPEDAQDVRASPLRAASLAGACPALIITAGLDPLRDEAAAYANRLREEGVEVSYRCYEGWPHGFLFWGETAAAQRAAGEVVEALTKALA